MKLNATALDRILWFLKVISIEFNCVVTCFCSLVWESVLSYCVYWGSTATCACSQCHPGQNQCRKVQGCLVAEDALILWASTRNVPEGYARGSNYVMPRAGSHRIMCGACQQQQPDVPGKAPRQEGAGLSQQPRRRASDVQQGPGSSLAQGGRELTPHPSLGSPASSLWEWQRILHVLLLPSVFASSFALGFFFPYS